MSTTLLLIRHAQQESGHSTEDSTPLSSNGRLIQERMSLLLQKEGYRPSRILTSPLLRAKETADILGALFHVVPEEEALGYNIDKDLLLKKIPDPKLNQTIIFVGHSPSLFRFAEMLVGKIEKIYDIERSGALVLSLDDVKFGKANFINYYSPSNLSIIG